MAKATQYSDQRACWASAKALRATWRTKRTFVTAAEFLPEASPRAKTAVLALEGVRSGDPR
jgi:hypothetical protein